MKQVMRILPLALMLFLGATAFAQIDLGARAGINLATWNIDAEDAELDPENLLGFQFAATIGVPIGESGLRLQPEVSFIQKGFKATDDAFNAEYEESHSYLEIPIMLQYVFGDDEGFFGFVQAGPSVGFALSGTGTLSIGGNEEKEDIDYDEEMYNTTDIGAQFGAGVGTKAGPGVLYLDARYLLGISNINDSETSDEETYTNRGIGISVGYRVPIGE